MTTSACFLAPGWVGLCDDGSLTLVDSRDGLSLALTGDLKNAFLSNALLESPSFTTMASLDPMMARLRHSLEAANPLPMDRSVLLKGGGWSRLFIELTGQCNENCLHCYAEASPSVTAALTENQVLAAIEDGSELGFTSVQLTGGDPLISKTCLAAATRATELAFPMVEVYTNGLALKGDLFKGLAALEVAFAFSVYGQDPLVHDVVTRVPGSHRLTLEAIRRTVSAGLRVRIGIVDTGTTGFDLNHTIELLTSLGVTEENIRWDVERGVGRGSFAPAGNPLHHASTDYSPEPLDADSMPDTFNGTAAVSYTGEVYPCIFTRDRPLGNIRDESLQQILERKDDVTFELDKLNNDMAACTENLTCWRCRMRSCLLEDKTA